MMLSMLAVPTSVARLLLETYHRIIWLLSFQYPFNNVGIASLMYVLLMAPVMNSANDNARIIRKNEVIVLNACMPVNIVNSVSIVDNIMVMTGIIIIR